MDSQPREDRVARELRRQQLALRMIRHEVRTQTIRLWTGLADSTIYRLCALVQGGAPARPRGPAPSHVGRFLRTARLRTEAAAVAGICYVMGVLPQQPLVNARRVFPTLARGERLCEAFERFRALVPQSELTLEHVIGLAVALAEGSELCLMHCVDCGAAVLVDKLGLMRRRCADCERHVHAETGTDQCGTVADGPANNSTASGSQGRLFR